MQKNNRCIQWIISVHYLASCYKRIFHSFPDLPDDSKTRKHAYFHHLNTSLRSYSGLITTENPTNPELYKYLDFAYHNKNRTMGIIEKPSWLTIERMIVESVSSPSGGNRANGRITKLVNGIIIHAAKFTSTIKQSELNSLRVSKKAPFWVKFYKCSIFME